MNSILVRKYKPKDHSDVKRIFSSGNNGKIKNGLRIGRKSPRILGYLTLLFSIGFLYSFLYGCLFVLFGLFIHCLSVTLFYQSYVWWVMIFLTQIDLYQRLSFLHRSNQKMGFPRMIHVLNMFHVEESPKDCYFVV